MWQKSDVTELHTRIEATHRMDKSVKTAILLLDRLPSWKKLNVTAFLATGIGDSSPDAMGARYRDGIGREYTRLFEEPIVVFAGSLDTLQKALSVGHEKALVRSACIEAMFQQSDGDSGRKVFQADEPDSLNLVGVALRGPRKHIDVATKYASLHP
jgi:hypothetical protein